MVTGKNIEENKQKNSSIQIGRTEKGDQKSKTNAHAMHRRKQQVIIKLLFVHIRTLLQTTKYHQIKTQFE